MASAGEEVILVHRLWMPALALAARGYRARRFAYPSLRRNLASHLSALDREVRASGEGMRLVGHSLGALLVLSPLAREEGARVGRTVLMGPPCMASPPLMFFRTVHSPQWRKKAPP